MSLMSMRRKMASKRTATYILWLLIVVFLAGIALWSVPGGNAGKFGSNAQNAGIVAEVGKEKITAGDIDEDFFRQQEASRGSFDFNMAVRVRQQVFSAAVDDIILEQTAKKMGVKSWPWTLRKMAREFAEVQLADMRDQARTSAKSDADKAQAAKSKDKTDASKPKTENEYYQEQLVSQMQNMGESNAKQVTDEQFIRAFVRMATSNAEGGSYDQLVNLSRIRLVGAKVAEGMNVSPFTKEFARKLNEKEVKASWIFVAAKQKTVKGLQEAQKTASKLHDDLITNKITFAEAAKKSDDMMSSYQGGSLGWIVAASQMSQPMTEYLAFSQEKGKIGPLTAITLSSQFMPGDPQVGYGFLKVEDIRDRTEEGRDFNWKRDQDVAMMRAKQRFEIGLGQNYLGIERAKTPITIVAKEFQVYEAQQTGDYKKFFALMEEALPDKSLPGIVAASFKYYLAQDEKDPKKRLDLLTGAVQFAGANDAPNLYLEMAREYLKLSDKELALQQLGYAADGAENMDADGSLHEKLKTEFKNAGDMENVQRMAEWIKAHPKPENSDGMMSAPITIPAQ